MSPKKKRHFITDMTSFFKIFLQAQPVKEGLESWCFILEILSETKIRDLHH